MKPFHEVKNTLKIFWILGRHYINSWHIRNDTFSVRSTWVQFEEIFATVEVATTIKGIKSGKAVGEDEIRPKMLKVLTEQEFSG